jgi:hypothetical protein
MSARAATSDWSLEVIRGRDVGRVYDVDGAEVLLGNDLGLEPGIDLADQEGNAPRRMAARQARIERTAQGLSLRDLDSPGGTFVNRQRVLSGQARPLQEGDVIQVGGVQLRVVKGAVIDAMAPHPPGERGLDLPPSPLRGEGRGEGIDGGRRPASATAPHPDPPPGGERGSEKTSAPRRGEGVAGVSAAASKAPPPRAARSAGALAFRLKSGPTCRSWDDFLTVSAQRWEELRDELTSGRLAAYLASIGRSDVAPSPSTPGTPDERLDAWLAGLPTTKPARPELDVHPATLVVRVAPGGGSTRRTIRLSNAGYRLLRAEARVEPPGTSWLAVAPEVAGRSVVAVEGADLPLEITIPDRIDAPLSATLVIDSNGGMRRVEVRLEPPTAPDAIPDAQATVIALADWGLRERIAPIPVGTRVLYAATAAAAFRLAIGLAGRFLGSSADANLSLAPAAFLFAALGGIGGVILARRRGAWADLPSCGFAGAFAGVLVAACLVAVGRSVEPLLGATLAGWNLVSALLWGLLGAGAAAASAWLVPFRSTPGEKA